MNNHHLVLDQFYTTGELMHLFKAALPKTYLAEALQTQERLANKRFRGKVETGGTGWLSIVKTGLNLLQKQEYKQKAAASGGKTERREGRQ